jgi:hypothetical protein
LLEGGKTAIMLVTEDDIASFIDNGISLYLANALHGFGRRQKLAGS